MRSAMITVLLFVLAACGPTAASLPTTAPTLPPPTQETIDTEVETDGGDLVLGETGSGLFTATLTGDVEGNIAGSGNFACVTGQTMLDSGTVGTGNSITFTLPSSIATGEYTVGTGENTITAVMIADGSAYSQEVFGILTLNALPTAAGEAVSGSFDMNFANESGQNVNAVGTFELTAASVCS